MCLSRVVDEHEAAGRVAYSYRTTPIAVDTGKDYRAHGWYRGWYGAACARRPDKVKARAHYKQIK